MLKRDLVLVIVKASLAVQKNHILRIVAMDNLADKNKNQLNSLPKKATTTTTYFLLVILTSNMRTMVKTGLLK
jgi:hypothetical protein